MRIERLEIEGFGPFAEAQTIDFGPLDEAGVFLITGRTGSGKSSILDAVCFALYGTAPRYDAAPHRLRSDHAGPGTATRVALTFAVADERWRVTRSPEYERPKRRGDGTTVQPQSAALERWDGVGWTGVAARAVDVAEHLAPVLQLTREQFLQVILLAQGRFQEFLRARSEDRLSLLRALFGTGRFQRFEAEVADRAKALEQSVGDRSAATDAELARLARLVEAPEDDALGLEWAQRTADDLQAAADAARQRIDDADAAFALADRAAERATGDADLQRRRDAARAALMRSAEEQPRIEALRTRVADAVRALPVTPALAEAARTTAAQLDAQDEAAAAAQRLGAPVEHPGSAAAALDGTLGSLAGPLAEEARLPAAAAAVEAAHADRSAAVRRGEDAARRAADLPERRARLEQQRTDAAVLAGREDAAAATLLEARRVESAAVRARSLATVAAAAEAEWAAALRTQEQAVARTRALLDARLAGAAELLAEHLVEGAPCAVCGSVQHPSPARGDGSTPDDAAVSSAEDVQRSATEGTAAARARAAAAGGAAATAAAEAGGASVEAAAPAVRAAEQALQQARGARLERDRLDGALAELVQQAALLQHAAEEAQQAVLAAAQRAAAATADRDAAAARVDAARDDQPSVAARVAALTRRRTALRAAADAEQRLAAARTACAQAADRLVAALAEAGLPDAASAQAAAMGEAERRGLEARVRAFDDERSTAAARLADPDVAGAPEEPADTAGTAAAKAEALAARAEAGDRAADARARARVAAGVVLAVRRTDEAIAEDRAQLAVLAPLADVVRGGGANERRMRLESYVLAARLEQIVDAANARLTTMTDGRFRLQHDDSVGYRNARSGLGLEVLDEHTGRPRPIASLSGGETFLASLALALGLAEVVSSEAGGVRLDTLFVDEGFGSLDRQTLDTAMETLDSLRAGGRVVGLISHVEAMQEDIPAGLHVERSADGSSVVRLRTPATGALLRG